MTRPSFAHMDGTAGLPGTALQDQPSMVATSVLLTCRTYSVATVIASVQPTRPAGVPTATTEREPPPASVTVPQSASASGGSVVVGGGVVVTGGAQSISQL
ncbi:hypothetical protein ACFYTS_08590 [Nocardia sp. NPDC004151]|uniref:hypothetical protein n=1 Tax=Nocardia sp. NPDC004151 TaxID=3364304 RepID=UPI00367DD228